MRALVLAGGAGSRLRPLTDTRPKPLVPLLGDPFAAGLLSRLAEAGCDRATFLVGADAAPFADLVGIGADRGVAVDVVTEERPLDTAGAARRVLAGQGGGPVLVANGDILTDLDLDALVSAHAGRGAVATLALTRVGDTSAYGVVVTDDGGAVRAFVEKPSPGTVAADTVNAGTYVLDPDALAVFPGDGPLSFEREVFPGLLDHGARLLGVVSDAHFADLGTPARYRAGHAAVLAGRCRWPVGQGMSVEGGLAGHATAEVAADARLEAPVTLGRGVRVGAGAALRDVVALPEAVIGAGAVLEGCVLGEGAVVGQGAVLRGDVVVGDGTAVPDGERREGIVRLPEA
ncbi:MAG: NDP-sugar synthase [Egibacteraceae bacterium]